MKGPCRYYVKRAGVYYRSASLLWKEISAILIERRDFFKEIIEYFSIDHVERDAFPSSLLFGHTFHWQLADES